MVVWFPFEHRGKLEGGTVQEMHGLVLRGLQLGRHIPT